MELEVSILFLQQPVKERKTEGKAIENTGKKERKKLRQ
jgi:hypothetical protein